MSTFVLVHGSWRDGSVWNRVINRLQHHGHNAFGPTVPEAAVLLWEVSLEALAP